VIRVLLPALMIWALCFSVADCGSTQVQSPQHVEKPAATPTPPMITLTNQAPDGGFDITGDLIPSGADVVEIAISKVVNPERIALTLTVYLDDKRGSSVTDVEKNVLGSFSLYPPDRPGKFLLPFPPSLNKLPPSVKARMIFVLKRLDETKPWNKVEVEVSRPTFRSSQKN
jgi:hypothetical protein